ncbi:MAG: hypothetical protein JWM76_4038 [Pseudonocardiales bacterium]|nr:hypothetical protein [Pseudonocardiales bacterium]
MTVETPEGRGRSLSPALEQALRTGPFHTALHLAIGESNLTLDRLEVRLSQRDHHVGRSTLSYWQQGRRRPERPASLRALAALEDILGVPDTSLSSLLGPRKPRGRWIGYQGQELDWGDLWTNTEAVRRLAAIDRRRASERSQDISITELAQFGADRQLHTLGFQTLTKARRDSADRSQFVYEFDPGTDVTKIRITGLEGCRIGRRRQIREDRLIAFETLYDRPLAEGDTHFYTVTLDVSDAYDHDVDLVPQTIAGRVFRRSVANYILRLRFDQDMLPVHCYHTRSSRFGAAEQVLDDLLVSTEGTTFLDVQNAQPGLHAVRWEWE